MKDLVNSNELFIPMMGRPTGFDEPLIIFAIASEPMLLDHIIDQAKSDDERKILISVLRLKIQELHKSLNSTIKRIGNIKSGSN